MVGDEGVGKTSLLVTFVSHVFPESDEKRVFDDAMVLFFCE